MKIVKCMEDVEAIAASPNIKAVVKGEMEALIKGMSSGEVHYNPDRDGYVVLVEQGDTQEAIRNEIGTSLMNALWEGMKFVNNTFVGVVLFNNEYGLSVVIPDASWLDMQLRMKLFYEADIVPDGKA